MSDNNNNDDDVEGKKLNPSFHDLIKNRKIDKLNPIIHDLINQENMAGAINPEKILNPTLEELNPSFHDLGYQSDMAGAINHEDHLNPPLENAVNNDNINPPIEAGTSKNDSNPPKKEVHTILDNSSERTIKTKYYALRTISVFLKILAIIILIGGLASSYILYRDTSSVLTTIGIIIGALVACVVIWAHAELIILFIDVEANTRATKINTTPKYSR